MSPPSDYIRREIIARVKAETGRDLTIAGGTSFTIFPSLGLRLSDVSLSAPPSMGGEPLVKAANFDVGVQLLPLLRQEIVVDRLELNEPVFSLRVDAEGRKSWDMAGIGLPVRFAQDSHGTGLGDLIIGPAAAAKSREVAALSLDDIRITDGAVRYSDERNGAWGRFEGINARFSLPAMHEPLTGSGTVMAEGEPFDFKSTLTTPQDLAEQRPAKLALTVTGAPLSFSYDGTVGPNDGEGTITANSSSLRRFGALVGQRSVAGSGRGRSRFLGKTECHSKERASLEHRPQGRPHDGQRHGRVRGARRRAAARRRRSQDLRPERRRAAARCGHACGGAARRCRRRRR